MADGTETRSLTLSTSDGLTLEAECRVPDDASVAVVLCHPHPAAGGSMTSLVTSELFRLLPASGIAVLRFNFRGVGASEGSHDGGVAERLDILAAIDHVCGWSFGADTSLAVLDARISSWVCCAPPLRVVPLEELTAAAGSDPRPKVLIVPEHDQFRVPASAIEATADWVDTRVIAVSGADHFFVGRTDKVAAIVTEAVRA